MQSFKSFLEERKQDPVKLGVRAGRRFGKSSQYGFRRVEKGKHIPLQNYNEKAVDDADERLYDLGMYDDNGAKANAAEKKYWSLHRNDTLPIDKLLPTQPYVEVGDVERLAGKVSNTSPDHIHVVTHKGKHYVTDGHHAILAAKLRGEKTVKVKHLDMDKI
jgi:hypothetical protein